ncbi:MAG: hypothetical protein WC560_03825 [Syntrophales bacterium]
MRPFLEKFAGGGKIEATVCRCAHHAERETLFHVAIVFDFEKV